MTNSLASAQDLLHRWPLVDGHNDLPWMIRTRFDLQVEHLNLASGIAGTHTDMRRMRLGEVGAQFWSVYVSGELSGDAAAIATLEQIDVVYRLLQQYPRFLELALTADDVKRIFAKGKIASLLGAEGGHSIASSLGVLRMLYKLGVRYMTLTHNNSLSWADSATDAPISGGLSPFGGDVVNEMQRIGMLVDLSHTSANTARAALNIAQAPVIFSHSCAGALLDNPRNVPDDVLTQLSDNGGVCMVAFVPPFISSACWEWEIGLTDEMQRQGVKWSDLPERSKAISNYTARHARPRATLLQVADHIDHIREVAGVGHVGIGSDFDGTDEMPDGLEDVTCYPALVAELLDRGWSEDNCAQLCGGNVLRALRDAETFSQVGTADNEVRP
jgi:membrane dipeptidase